MRSSGVAVLVCLFTAAPALAHARCDEPGGRAGRTAFGDSWSASPDACNETGIRDGELLYEPLDWRDDRPVPLRRTLGITGMGAGTALAASGGAFVLLSTFMPTSSTAGNVARYGGIGMAVTGGALFLTGAVLTLIDLAATPAPTPDGRGGQLVASFRF